MNCWMTLKDFGMKDIHLKNCKLSDWQMASTEEVTADMASSILISPTKLHLPAIILISTERNLLTQVGSIENAIPVSMC